jgi:predicted phosphodiesterase
MEKWHGFIKILVTLGIFYLCFMVSTTNAQQRRNDSGDVRPASVFQTAVPAHDFDVILCRPTATSVTFSVLFYENMDIQLAYGRTPTEYAKTKVYEFKAGMPQEILLEHLQPDTQYDYVVLSKTGKSLTDTKTSFHTQRRPASDFTFTITSDSHLDENTDVKSYAATLLNAAGDSADFHLDLGDTFMTDKYREDYRKAFDQYLAQRYYLGLIGRSSPLFLALGNHDGEAGQRLNGSEDNMTVWSNRNRKSFFPMPVPDAFYTGNATKLPSIGFPQDYYAFEWGNALFVVLDPFLFTLRNGNDDPWERTLGKTQYDWLNATLAHSRAAFKFVFIHNLVGGVDLKGKARGGAEAAGLYEWGGLNPDGSNGFKAHRPDWAMSIHDLLKQQGVCAVFHGHDHLFAHQEKDGILYQCLPQPGAFKNGSMKYAGEYGYVGGVLRNDAGYLRVRVGSRQADIDYVGTQGKQVLHHFEIKAK